MNSLLKKRLPGILATGLIALAVGVAGAPASAATADTSSGATISGLTKKQKKAKKRALRKCAKKKPAKKARRCKRAVIKKYRKIAANNVPAGKTYTVDVGDNYFAPSMVNLKVNDLIKWDWRSVGGFEAHNVTLGQGPSGVSRNEFLSQTTAVPSYTFTRQFKKTGAYSFVCSLHFGMTMNANVTN